MVQVSGNSKFMIRVSKLMVYGSGKFIIPVSKLEPIYGISKLFIVSLQ